VPIYNALYSRHEEAQRPLPLPFADHSQPDVYEFVANQCLNPLPAAGDVDQGAALLYNAPALGGMETYQATWHRYTSHVHVSDPALEVLPGLVRVVHGATTMGERLYSKSKEFA